MWKILGVCFVLVNGGYAVYLNIFTLMLPPEPDSSPLLISVVWMGLTLIWWLHMNACEPLIRVNIKSFLELLEEGLSFLLAVL